MRRSAGRVSPRSRRRPPSAGPARWPSSRRGSVGTPSSGFASGRSPTLGGSLRDDGSVEARLLEAPRPPTDRFTDEPVTRRLGRMQRSPRPDLPGAPCGGPMADSSVGSRDPVWAPPAAGLRLPRQSHREGRAVAVGRLDFDRAAVNECDPAGDVRTRPQPRRAMVRLVVPDRRPPGSAGTACARRRARRPARRRAPSSPLRRRRRPP